GSAITTSAGLAKNTRPHLDGYQWHSLYAGMKIAGIGWMPHIESLGYPVVKERRTLAFCDLDAACAQLFQFDPDLVALLMEPMFEIDRKYRDADPGLGYPGLFPIIYWDDA